MSGAAPFDGNGYRKRVLAAVLERGGPDASDPLRALRPAGRGGRPLERRRGRRTDGGGLGLLAAPARPPEVRHPRRSARRGPRRQLRAAARPESPVHAGRPGARGPAGP
ncbi:hypothetical protein [Nocardioides sp. TF02-7]|uniref:hypothetical protein n=1 Tax=Nocardioides sp. TF02-7 TaxID=2917724 RepID=UPI001F0650CC|nr:hypothetical protein [Nocardioides sp. TF02-7]UMG91970.1 hypothetical protein MF408_18450 [Nocardioides sp. TF02-7]